ncbi:helix-turn-helix domain-containing protein [Maricaulis alexandrii]|uniref:helix-turn-helix domain-containing protein n=1 Tax=Maricaulis alexandrii TaxID=2570354 RepID=UPI0011083619|nr:helix-turn-helix transcriptional regulator [Maricaulis alexandrii]
MDISARLAANMKRLRKERGWSQEDLAHEAGLHRTYISQLERCKKAPTIVSLEQIVRALGVGFDEMLGE